MGMARVAQQHRSFLLRFWQAGNGGTPEWRFSLEDVRTHERHGFVDLASLMAFLEAQVEQLPAEQSKPEQPNH
jgi:hypothetical protein